MSITCAISDNQIKKLFKLTYKRMQEAIDSKTEFNADAYMKDLYNKISTREDADTAAKFIQQVPAIIRTVGAKTMFLNLDFTNNLDEIALKQLSRDFSIQAVKDKYEPIAEPKGAEPTEKQKQIEDLQLKQIELGEEPVTVIPSDRFKTLSPFSGTLQNFIKTKPFKQGDKAIYIESINPEKTHIINTFQKIKEIQAMSDVTDGIQYEGKTLMFRAYNLEKFATGANAELLDSETRKEVAISKGILNKQRNKEEVKVDPKITQIDKRVILILSNEIGQPIYVDDNGNLTDKEKGKIVYQFMRDVRKAGKDYSVTDIYGNEDQVISPQEFAKMTYNPQLDGTKQEYFDKVVAEQQQQMKELYDLQQKAIKDEAPLLPITGISTGVPSNLSKTSILLNEVTKFPGINDSVYETIETLPKDRGSLKQGATTIEINGDKFQIDRPNITKELAKEIAEVAASPLIPLDAKLKYINQFLPGNISAITKKYAFVLNKFGQLYFNEYSKFGTKKEDIVNGKGDLLNTEHLKENPNLIAELKEKIERVLLKGGPKGGPVLISYYSKGLKDKKEYQRLAEDGKSFNDENYIDFIKTFPSEVFLINADPGFYNYTVSYTTSDTLLGNVIKYTSAAKKAEDTEQSVLPTDAASLQIALSTARKIDLDAAGTLREKLEIKREEEYFDRLAYLEGYKPSTQSKQAETQQILTEPGAESPTNVNSPVNEIFNATTDKEIQDALSFIKSIPGREFNRKGFSKELLNPLKILNAKKWWNSEEIKPLRDLISFEHAANLVNSDVFATFIVNAGVLADVNDKMGTIKVNKLNGSFYQNLTVYHEAWHVFSQLFLTKDQKINLYTELQNYKDKNGNQPNKSKSFRELEEMLAEDFRNYVKTGKAKTTDPVKNSLFRKMLNFLKELFGKALSKFRKKEVQIESLSSPIAKQLFDNLYLGQFNSYQASINNAMLYELDRGVRQVNNPNEDALSPQDSNQISRTIDSAFSEIIDDIYNKGVLAYGYLAKSELQKEGTEVTEENIKRYIQSKELISESILMLSDPTKRSWMYEQTKQRLEETLKNETNKLKKAKGEKTFNDYTTLEEIKKNAIGVMKNKKGEDKYFFLTSQITDFSKLTPSLKKGERVKGLDYKDSIKILGDFYRHNDIAVNERPVDIVIVSRLEDAALQYQNYDKAGAEVYTSFEQNPEAANITLDEDQEIIRDNIRILQTTLSNWGNEKSGMVKYHMENTDYEVSKDKYDIQTTAEKKQSIDSEGNVVNEAETLGNEENNLEAKTGTLSLQQMMSKETTYLIKSLFKINSDGTTPVDRFGFKERADFNKVFTILAKTIGGERDRYTAYAKLREEADKFPELKQLYEKKYPDPSLANNKYEFDISKQFWLDFARIRIKYMQLFAYNDKESGTIDFKVKESSLAIDNTLNRWSGLFKSTLPTQYISKSKENLSSLNLNNLVNTFSTKGQLLPKDGLNFARAMAIDLDNNDNIQKELIANFDYYGLDYIFDIVKGFDAIEKLQGSNPNDPTLTKEKIKYLELFKKNPIDTLKDIIPVGVLSGIKGPVKELTQLKRLAELQSKYGFDSATTGVIRANGNTGYQEMNWSSAASYVYALNAVTDLHQLWTDPRFNYMSYMNPEINPHTLNLSIIKSLFNLKTGKKIPGKSLQLMAVDGTSLSNKKTIKKNGRDVEIEEAAGNTTTELDPQSKMLQELHTMSLGGVAEFPRHSEKKFSYGIKVIGGIEGNTVGFISKGVDKNLYVDMDKFFKNIDKNGISEGEVYAIGNNIFPYIQGEFDRIKKFRGANKEEYLKFTGYNKLVNDGNGNNVPAGSVFSAFDSILTPDTKNALYDLADKQLDVQLITYLKGTPLRKAIFNDIIAYFNEQQRNLDTLYFQKMPYLSKSMFEKIGYTSDQLTNKKVNELRNDKNVTNKILKAYVYNDFIHKYESAMIMYGDHAQWGHDKEDWTKRIPGLTSDGIGYLFDENTKIFINNYFNKNNTFASKITNENTPNYDQFKYSETLNTAVIKDAVRESIYLDDMIKAWKEEYSKIHDAETVDALIKKDIKAYKEMKEGDGMAYMTIDAYRTLHQTGRGWSMAQEDLYQKIIKGERVDPRTAKEFFPVYKLHYFGAIENNIIAARAMHKFAVIPLIPGVNAKEGSQLDVLHKKMMKENVQYVTFDSGSKASTLTSDGKVDDIFNKGSKSINDDSKFTINPIYMANLKEVTVINEYFKGTLPIATQTRGIIIDNLFQDGKIINSKNEPVVNEYLNSVKAYSDILKEELLNEVGFEFVDGRYIGNLDKFVEVIRDELKNRDTPEHLIRLLNTDLDKQLAMDLSLHPEADSVEKLIMSFLQNGLIKQKTNGEPLVQTPTTFTNGIWDAEYDILTDPEEIKKLLGTNTLPFYIRNINGRSTEMKVAIALQGDFVKLLNGKHTDGEKIATIDRLNEVIKDPKWLADNQDSVTMFGPRIPNDATNTIEAATVWHFLPEAFGNSIIIPTEIVAKAGSDFDGDKLFMTFPNIDREGKVISKGVDNFDKVLKETKALEKAKKLKKGMTTSASLIAQQKKYLQNRFKNSAVEILMLPENYVYLTKPNGTYLVDTYVEELEENKTGYNRYTNTHNEAPKTSASDENGKRKTVISPTRVLEVTYNLYKHDANLSLEPSLGIMAKLAKSHPIYKSIGAKMPAVYRASSYNQSLAKTLESGYVLPVVMRFTHNKTTNGAGQEVISLAGERTQKGSRISDVISHALQGILDRAKESFPFELKLVPQSMDVLSYMLQAGVNEEEIFFFLNQPLIAEYFEQQRLKDSAYSNIVPSATTGSIANNIVNNFLSQYSNDTLNDIVKQINISKIRYVINQLKVTGLDQKLFYTLKDSKLKGVREVTLQELIDNLNNGGLAPENIATIGYDKSFTIPPVYTAATNLNLNSAANFAFTTEYLSNRFLPKGDVPLSTLKEGFKSNDTKSFTSLALFMNYLELERQFKGMNDLQQTFSPDTSKLTTVQQIIKRQEAYKELSKRTSIDQDFLKRLINDSVLASFNQDKLILDLANPLFNIRLNPMITKFISDTFSNQDRATMVRNNPTFGKGLKGQERFSTLFNNAVINYIYQNYMSNFNNAKGELVNIPETYKKQDVIVKDDLPMDAGVFEEGIAINTKIIERDFATKAYLNINTSADSYANRGLDTFTLKQDPFQTLASYYRYVIAREHIRVNTSAEDLENNKYFMKKVADLGNVDAAYESYISERALAASYNNKYIMGKTKYSYSDSVMNLIDEFGDVLKVNYPITAQLAPGENTEGAKVLQLNNKKEAEGDLASIYYNNLRSLSDPSIMKVKNVSDNNRISEMFEQFSLMMFYQHGVGNTKLGFTKVLDPSQYKMVMQDSGSPGFLANYLDEETLYKIFNTVVSMDRFKNHLINPEEYRHADIADIAAGNTTENSTDEVEMSFDEDEGENLVPVRLINQEDVDLFKQAVDRAKGKKPERWFTSKTLFPAFYNSATGKREGMPQTTIWIKNRYGNYDMLDQESGEVYYENVNLATGMHMVPKVEGEQKPTEVKAVADIPQNKVSGIESFGSTVTANAEAIKALGANPHSIDMIEAGFRTRTTRSESEMAKYKIKVGDTIKHFGKSADGTTKNISAKVTAIHPKGTPGFKSTWTKEGWRAEDVNVIDRFKDGAAAIEFEVIKPTEAPVSQNNKPKGQQVKEGIYVNQGALTKEEQLELFNYLKPYLEEQADKSLKANQGSKMIGLGLRWDYTSNNPGKVSVNIPDPIKRNPKYGYYNQSVNGQPLGEITPRFRELMQKATGVDMTYYDGAIINLYEKDTFISSHNDVDESKSAIKYPVIGINIGGKGNFSIERLGPENAMLNLEAGTGYVFGVDGINREVWHRTFPTPQDSFLPELTTKIDGKTYPAGSYRITITMRRVKPLAQGMPQAPSIVSDTTTPTPAPTNNPAEYTNHSGGAYGGDTFWDIIGREFGVTKHMHYKDAGNANLSQKLKNAGVTATVLTKEQMDTARTEVENLLGKKYPDTLEGNLQVRNYYQVANADAVFAIAKLNQNDDGVSGGTNTAVQLGIKLNKPVYVWDITSEKWFVWNAKTETLAGESNPTFEEYYELDAEGRVTDNTVPKLTTNFAGVGSRDIENYNTKDKDGKWTPRKEYLGAAKEAAAKKAIRDVYANTFKPTTQPSTSVKPTVEPVSPAPIDSLEYDMKVYDFLLTDSGGVPPTDFNSGTNGIRMYKLNKFGNYDLVDKTTGEIYVRNLNMETGKQETEPGLDTPVDPVVIQRELNRIITLRAETNIEEQLAGLGYDINDIINNLANAKTQEDLNKITKILDKLC